MVALVVYGCKLFLKTLCCSLVITSCKFRACSYIEIDSPAQVFLFDFCEISQNSLLQNNRERLLLETEWCYGKSIVEINNSSEELLKDWAKKLCQSAILLKLTER